MNAEIQASRFAREHPRLLRGTRRSTFCKRGGAKTRCKRISKWGKCVSKSVVAHTPHRSHATRKHYSIVCKTKQKQNGASAAVCMDILVGCAHGDARRCVGGSPQGDVWHEASGLERQVGHGRSRRQMNLQPLLDGRSLVRVAVGRLHGVAHDLHRDWALEPTRGVCHCVSSGRPLST